MTPCSAAASRKLSCLAAVSNALSEFRGGQTIGVHGPLAPPSGSIILSQTTSNVGRGQSLSETASRGETGPDCGPPERTARDPQRNACGSPGRARPRAASLRPPVAVQMAQARFPGAGWVVHEVSVPGYASQILSHPLRKIGCERLRTSPRLSNRGPDRDGPAFPRMVRIAREGLARPIVYRGFGDAFDSVGSLVGCITKRAESREPRAESPRAESREPRAESREAESREPRAESREPRAESREPRAESREPRAESREPRARARAESREPRAESPRAESQPRAESREPRAESREPRAESREPRAESREPRAESREPRAESREPSCVRGEARRLDLPRPHGQPSPTATPTLPPPARRRRPHAPARIPAVRDGASPASSGAWASR